jgi:hypothetical protein
MEQGFNQLCVWPGCVVGKERIQDFEKYFLDEFGAKVKYLTEIVTNPDLDGAGEVVPDTGGRNDLFFYLHDDNVNNFAIQRLQMGIRWWEDVIKYNDGSSHLYPTEFIEAHPPTW